MSAKTVLIVGGSGFIGSRLAAALKDEYRVYATFHKNAQQIPGVTFIPSHFEEESYVKKLILMTAPDAILFSVGRFDSEWARDHTIDAKMSISGSALAVLRANRLLQNRIIYLSSCYLFDGLEGNYHETDIPLPASDLGKVQLSAENHVRERAMNYVILRSSPIIGVGNHNHPSFLDHLRTRLAQNQTVELSNSEVHSFVLVNHVIETIVTLINRGPRNSILHLGGLTRTTYYEFGRHFARRFGFNEKLILEKERDERKEYLRKTDVSLNSTLACKTLQFKPLTLDQSFDLFEESVIRTAL